MKFVLCMTFCLCFTSVLSNCCSRIDSNCCIKQCHRSSTCCSQSCCTQSCCSQSCPDCCQLTTISSSTITGPTTATIQPATTQAPIRAPDHKIDNTVHTNKRIDITISNKLENHNVIRNPIVVENNNQINVVVKPSIPKTTVTFPTTTTFPTKTTFDILPTFQTTTPSPTAPTSTTTEKGECCVVLKPCHGTLCRNYFCGHQCTSPVIYVPVNPCLYHSCRRRQTWYRESCIRTNYFPYNVCDHVQQDCSRCYHDYYQSYQTYLQCYGCFY